MTAPSRCTAITRARKPCANRPVQGLTRCAVHQADSRSARQHTRADYAGVRALDVRHEGRPLVVAWTVGSSVGDACPVCGDPDADVPQVSLGVFLEGSWDVPVCYPCLARIGPAFHDALMDWENLALDPGQRDWLAWTLTNTALWSSWWEAGHPGPCPGPHACDHPDHAEHEGDG